METIKRGTLAALLGLVIGVAPGAAQDRERTCRCVDADGVEIERCTCFRSPDVEALIAGVRALPPGQPRLGISIDPAQAAARDAEGVLVRGVLEGGPADEAGLREGDVITSIDGRSLVTPVDADVEETFDLDGSIPVQRLLALSRELEPGRSVEVEYLRDGRRQTTMVEVEDLAGRWGDVGVALPRWGADRFRGRAPEPPMAPRTFELRMGPDRDARFFGGPGARGFFWGGLHGDGLELAELNPGLGAYFGAESGVLVLERGRSSGLGLEAGDVVLRIGAREVRTPERFRRIVSSYGQDEDIEFHVLREGEEIVVIGRLRY